MRVLRWCISLGAKFGRVVPLATATVALATLVSQLSILFAFFLPLKVVILLGSDRVPRYFPDFLTGLDRDLLIVLLSGSALAFYLLYLLSERVSQTAAEAGSRRLLAKSQKIVLFENQNSLASSAYQRYARALAGGLFVMVGLAALGVIYPAMALLLVTLALAVLFAFVVWARLTLGLDGPPGEGLPRVLGTVSGFGFMLAFAYLVADFILWSGPGLIVAIVALLLVRQILNRATGMVIDIAALHKQKLKLDALFFHGRILLDTNQGSSDASMLAPASRDVWCRRLLDEYVDTGSRACSTRWFQLGVPGVTGFRVVPKDHPATFLIKVFDSNRSALAHHEATLLGAPPRGLPALKLLGVTEIHGRSCHLLEFPELLHPVPDRARQLMQEARARLLAVEPPPALIQRYLRSRPMLWQRIDPQMFTRLGWASNDESTDALLEAVQQQRAELRAILQNLPIVIVNRVTPRDSVVTDGESGVLLHWGRWSLEPLGAGWPTAAGALVDLQAELGKAASVRDALRSVEPIGAELAALCFDMEREYVRQRFSSALALLPAIMERLEAIRRGRSLPGHEAAL